MTARSSQKLADALRASGFEDLAKRAEADEFHDFLSPHAFPEMQLIGELDALIYTAKTGRNQAINIRSRAINGEFDADYEESEEWAASPQGQNALRRLARGE
jgi:hypothetical protein